MEQANTSCDCPGCKFANKKYYYNWKEACQSSVSGKGSYKDEPLVDECAGGGTAHNYVEDEQEPFMADHLSEEELPAVIPAGQGTMDATV